MAGERGANCCDGLLEMEAMKKAVIKDKASGCLLAIFLALILDGAPDYASSIL